MTTVKQFRLPDVGEGLTEAEIVSWKVGRGDTVKVNDVIVEIETAKSLVELPCPYAGTVSELLVAEGATVDVGTAIIAVDTGAAAGAAPPGGPAAAADVPAPSGDAAVEPGLIGGPAPGGRTSVLVGYGPRSTEAKRRPRKGSVVPDEPAAAMAGAAVQTSADRAPAEPAPALPAEQAEPALPTERAEPARPAGQGGADRPAGGAAPEATPRTARPVLAKPPVRKLAKDLGIDLTELTGSGPGGIVTRADVEAAAAGTAAPAAEDVDTPVSGGTFAPGAREARVPVKGVRKATAQAMVASAFTAPHVTEWTTVDVTRTMRLVERLRDDRELAGVRVSPLLVVARAVLLAVRRHPDINASWDDAAQEIVVKRYVNLGIAAATPRGLVVPNVKDADRMSLPELAKALGELTETARAGRTTPADMQGGTLTITNVGVFGVDGGTPILNPGEAAILAVGAVRERPWVHKGRVRPRSVLQLSLSFDHRLVDGELGSRFLADVARLLERPDQAMVWA